MSESLINTIYMSVAFLALFGSAELLYHVFKIQAEITRKYVHTVTGLLTMLFPLLIGNHWLVLLLCSSFLIILVASLYFKMLPSINAVQRVTRGSILYPIVVYGCYLLFYYYGELRFFYLPILILAICDPIAALVGKKWPMGSYYLFGHSKTMSGSFGFFSSATIMCIAIMVGVEELNFSDAILISLIVALFTCAAEAVTHKGYDNLTIPASALLALTITQEMF